MIETVAVTDHTPVPWTKRINPIWWLKCGDTFTAPLINNGTPYLPDVKQQWLRDLYWFWRNPCGNFVGCVIGVETINYEVTGTAPVLATTGRDCVPQQTGWRWAAIKIGFAYLPFVSFWNGKVEFYLGWRPASGGFGLKIVFPHQA